ncbi:alpha/beta fold hydrolase [Streptomyces sp. NPDC052052]|uniref:esterase/lipase family protein n=1 Tax=Streptomyces sp. NPDC052052 TaxID=3154756 RepID=UPI0034391E70
MKVLPFLRPLPGRPCRCGIQLSSALIKATALEPVVLTGQMLLAGIIGERRPAPRPAGPTTGSAAAPATAPAAAPHTVPAPASTTTAASTGSLGLRGGEPPPVVLLHGLTDNRSAFVPLRRTLARHGRHHLESLNYASLTCDIRTAAELLGRHIEEICARTGHQKVDIVGHGLGGLIARYYAQRLGGDQRVRTLVTLGAPHGGTSVAPPAGAHPLVSQMRRGSGPIEELRRPAPGCRTRFVSFWSEFDRVIVPAEAACIDHPDLDALNVHVSEIGHLALPVHPAVVAAVRQALDSRASMIEASGGTLPPSTSEAPAGTARTTRTEQTVRAAGTEQTAGTATTAGTTGTGPVTRSHRSSSTPPHSRPH